MDSKKKTIAEIRQHSRQLVRELGMIRGVYQGTGHTVSQCHVLFELAAHRSLNLMELADNLLIDKSNTSRTVRKLVDEGLIESEKVSSDNRQKLFKLTRAGEKVLAEVVENADVQVNTALENLDDDQVQTVIQGMRLYASALRKSRLQEQFVLRPIQKKDDPHIAKVIREVMTEFQAIGDGYSINDPEVDDMFATYRDKQSVYYVITQDEKIVGGGGIGPLKGGGRSTCELQKMFFLPALRGCGMGRRLLRLLLDEARKRGYKKCYLETLDRMWQAIELYRKHGFQPLQKPMGNTGHCACDKWFVLEL